MSKPRAPMLDRIACGLATPQFDIQTRYKRDPLSERKVVDLDRRAARPAWPQLACTGPEPWRQPRETPMVSVIHLAQEGRPRR